MSPFFDFVAGFATARIFVKVFESSQSILLALLLEYISAKVQNIYLLAFGSKQGHYKQ